MRKLALSIEDMEILKKLGVDTSKASLYYRYPAVPEFKSTITISVVGDYDNLKAWEEGGHGIGAFDLQDILGILPPRLKSKYILKFYKVGDLYLLEYSHSNSENTLHTTTHKDAIAAAYEMLIWYLTYYKKA